MGIVGPSTRRLGTCWVTACRPAGATLSETSVTPSREAPRRLARLALAPRVAQSCPEPCRLANGLLHRPWLPTQFAPRLRAVHRGFRAHQPQRRQRELLVGAAQSGLGGTHGRQAVRHRQRDRLDGRRHPGCLCGDADDLGIGDRLLRDQVSLTDAAILGGEPAAAPVISADRPYTVRVRFPPENRASLEAMRDTLLTSSTGKTATLGALATITELPPQTEIRRENLQRDVSVTARLEGTDLGSAVTAVQKAVDALHLPSSIRVEYGGTYRPQQKSFSDLVLVLLLAIVLVFIVLLFEFGSFAAPLAILASALLSTSGVFIALMITRTTFNVSSFMGMIMVVGIVAKNGILLLDADQKFRTLGFSAEDAMLQAGRRRLRPIVMTALATVAGMLPLAFALGAGSQMLQPLAIAVIGGVLISMALSLIITPAVHYYLSDRHTGPQPG